MKRGSEQISSSDFKVIWSEEAHDSYGYINPSQEFYSSIKDATNKFNKVIADEKVQKAEVSFTMSYTDCISHNNSFWLAIFNRKHKVISSHALYQNLWAADYKRNGCSEKPFYYNPDGTIFKPPVSKEEIVVEAVETDQSEKNDLKSEIYTTGPYIKDHIVFGIIKKFLEQIDEFKGTTYDNDCSYARIWFTENMKVVEDKRKIINDHFGWSILCKPVSYDKYDDDNPFMQSSIGIEVVPKDIADKSDKYNGDPMAAAFGACRESGIIVR